MANILSTASKVLSTASKAAQIAGRRVAQTSKNRGFSTRPPEPPTDVEFKVMVAGGIAGLGYGAYVGKQQCNEPAARAYTTTIFAIIGGAGGASWSYAAARTFPIGPVLFAGLVAYSQCEAKQPTFAEREAKRVPELPGK